MNSELLSHPAVRLGLWLKDARTARGFVKRVFAEKIHLCPAKYTEVEAGVVAWIEAKQEKAIEASLDLAEVVLVQFRELLAAARSHYALTFGDIFSREQLTPMRGRLHPDKTIRDMECEMILDAVFAPLT